MKTINKILTTLLLLPLLLITQQTMANDSEVRVIEMTGNNQLEFSVTDIEARPGEKIKVVLTTISDFPKMAMAHNFVLLDSGVDAAAVASASAKAHDNEYIAPEMTDKILAYTGLAGGDETVEVTFTVPDDTGTYEYICSFPGHFSGGMKGTLTVKKQAT